jgi:hypothetical protein
VRDGASRAVRARRAGHGHRSPPLLQPPPDVTGALAAALPLLRMPNTIVIASNLRRSINMARIASASQLDVPGDKIQVLSCLQEISHDINTLMISKVYAISLIALSRVVSRENHHAKLFNVSENYGTRMPMIKELCDRLTALTPSTPSRVTTTSSRPSARRRTRYHLLPYMYSPGYTTHATGVPIARALFLEFL